MGKLSLSFYRVLSRLKTKLFSISISGAFSEFGSHSVIVPPARIDGESRISLGERVYVGAGSWLQTLPALQENRVALSIGNGTSIAGNCVISAAHSVRIEEDVLLARNVYISDHIHRYSEIGVPVQAQGIEKIRAVVIRRGAWLGQNVVVCPGVTVGEGAVVGANSVVTIDVPDFAVAVGAPARVVKTFAVVAG